jgi:hypothetical protein
LAKRESRLCASIAAYGQSRCTMSRNTYREVRMDVYIRDRDIVPASYSAAKRVQVFLGLVPAGVSSYKGDAG